MSEFLDGRDPGRVTVLIADDSVFMRHMLRRALGRHPRIDVIAEARDGSEAVQKNRETRPDVIVLDVEMPRMDGLTALKTMMADRPIPVVMFSSLTHKGAQVTLDALSLGAVDFLPKPASGFELDDAAEELCRKVLASAQARPRVRTGYPEEDARYRGAGTPSAVGRNATSREAGSLREAGSVRQAESLREAGSLVVIGSSTGGPQALEDLVPRLPADLPSGVIVCQHMPAGFTSSMARRLDAVSALSVREAVSGETVLAGEVLIAPGGYHLRVLPFGNGQAAKVATDDGPQVHGVKPAVDVTLLDAAAIYGERLMVVILSGMGVDGAQGAKAAKDRGATVIVQDESTSVVWGMPKACYELGICDKVLPLCHIVDEIARFS